MRNSCFPWSTRRLRTANVSSPLRMYFSKREMGGEGQCRPCPGTLPQLLSTLTHVPLDPLVHEALHVHVSNGILGVVEAQ